MIRLNRREKNIILAACGLLIVFSAFQFLIFPMTDKKERLQRVVQVKSGILNQVSQLAADYRVEKQKASSFKQLMDSRQKGFSLFSFLDRLAGQSGIKDRVAYMKPSSSSAKTSGYRISKVEVKLNGVDLRQLTSFLYAVETSENEVAVDRISISAAEKKENGLEVLILFETFGL